MVRCHQAAFQRCRFVCTAVTDERLTRFTNCSQRVPPMGLTCIQQTKAGTFKAMRRRETTPGKEKGIICNVERRDFQLQKSSRRLRKDCVHCGYVDLKIKHLLEVGWLPDSWASLVPLPKGLCSHYCLCVGWFCSQWNYTKGYCILCKKKENNWWKGRGCGES